MKRRSFFASLVGVFFAPKLVEELVVYSQIHEMCRSFERANSRALQIYREAAMEKAWLQWNGKDQEWVRLEQAENDMLEKEFCLS